MQVTFSTGKLQKLCNSASKLRGDYGPRMAKLIQVRLTDLAGANHLGEFRNLPGRCHQLTADLRWHCALDLEHPDRLVFRPANDPLPLNDSGSLDWDKVTKVEIVAIGDYH